MKLKPPQEPRRSGAERLVPRPDRERWHDREGKALVGHAWQPIRPLSRADRTYDFTFLDAWRDRWDAFRTRPSGRVRLAAGLRRLERLWSRGTTP